MYRGYICAVLFWSTVIAHRFGIANMKFEFAVQERDVGLQDAIKTPKLQ